tara:strand:- start:14673 stop:15869 length:1197 start_codon:yes stop_codon:yes gene_type:complete
MINIWNYKEHFNVNEIIVTDNQQNVENSLIISNKLLADLIDNIVSTNRINGKIIGKDSQIAVVIDPYINYYILKNKIQPEEYKRGIFVCISTIRLGADKCMWDLKNKVVAYVTMTDYLFLQAFIKAYRQDVKKIIIVRININNIKDKKFDYLFTYVVIGSNYMNFLKSKQVFINGFDDIDIYRIKAFYPFIEENYGSIREYFKKESDDIYNIYLSNKNTLIPTMNLHIIRSTENFITKLDISEDYLADVDKEYYTSNNGGNYGCYGNGNIINKFECDSLYNYQGKSKNYYSKWDKKCSTNEECPYYKANTNYPNERGLCLNGFCELPIGVKRIGFTKYKDDGVNRALCYNCENTTDNNCCANIEDQNGNNDFIFKDDFNDRVKYKLNTIISLLNYRES